MGNYLEDTISSVLKNLGSGDEYFVVDGSSSDSSIDVIQRFEGSLTGWISEPDLGYADAVAKGFGFGTGQLLCWVNSGDLLLDGALEKARSALRDDRVDLIFGDDLNIDEKNMVLGVSNGYVPDLRAIMLFGGWTPLQESCFWKRDIYEKVGGLDPRKKYAADYDLFLRVSLVGRCRYYPAIFGAFRSHDGQLSKAKRSLYVTEVEKSRAQKLAALPRNPFIILIKIYFWLKVRWRARMQVKKRNLSHLRGKCVFEVPCLDTDDLLKVKHGV